MTEKTAYLPYKVKDISLADWGRKEIELAECKTGDLICVFGTGAYNISMSSNYNRIPRPAALLVKDGEAEIIQKRESPFDLLKYDVLPDRFIKQN